MKSSATVKPKRRASHKGICWLAIACAWFVSIPFTMGYGRADVSVAQPTGVVVSGQLLLVSTPTCNPGTPNLPRQILAFNASGGTATVFSDLETLPNADIPCNPNAASGFESYLAVSAGLGGFPAGEVYVLLHDQIYQIPPAGGSPTLFATLPAATHGIVFDQIGNFGYDMIVTTRIGRIFSGVYRVNSAGQVSSPVATFKSLIEGPAIA